jgi:hypothetical protein
MTTIRQGQAGLTLPTDFNAKVFDSNEVVLFDLFRESLRAGSAMVEGRTFINCRLDGPAVMAAVGGCEFDSTDFGYASGDIRTMIIRSAAPNRMIGALPFKDCKFIGCMFFAVGFTGPDSFLNQIQALETRS